MSIIACAGSDEPGANFTPPTLGDFMKKQAVESRRLREAIAGAQVIREAKEFHLRQSRKYGINTNRGLAHFRASRMYTREGNRLQEMFDDSSQEHGPLPPKVVAKAAKSAMKFHKNQADKAGLDSDLGHAHIAAMENHADIFRKAKQQHQQSKQQGQPMQASAEGGPGSGPRPHGGSQKKSPSGNKYFRKLDALYKKDKDTRFWVPEPGQRVLPKSDPNLKQDYAEHLAQHSGMSYKEARQVVDAWSKAKSSKEALPGHGSKQSPVPVPKKSDQPSEDIQDPTKPPVNLHPADANKPMRKLQQNESRRKAIANFGRESGKHVRRGPDDDMERSDPKGAGTLMDDDLVYRGPRTKEARRSLRRPIWETDDSERDRSASGLTA